MKWKFWGNSARSRTGEAQSIKKPSRPKEVPSSVGRYLVVELGCDPDWVWRLKGISSPVEGRKRQFEVLVFSDERAAASGIYIRNADDLKAHPELILLEGRYEKDSSRIEVRALQETLLKKAAA